jgi:hypothetical protein
VCKKTSKSNDGQSLLGDCLTPRIDLKPKHHMSPLTTPYKTNDRLVGVTNCGHFASSNLRLVESYVGDSNICIFEEFISLKSVNKSTT